MLHNGDKFFKQEPDYEAVAEDTFIFNYQLGILPNQAYAHPLEWHLGEKEAENKENKDRVHPLAIVEEDKWVLHCPPTQGYLQLQGLTEVEIHHYIAPEMLAVINAIKSPKLYIAIPDDATVKKPNELQLCMKLISNFLLCIFHTQLQA